MSAPAASTAATAPSGILPASLDGLLQALHPFWVRTAADLGRQRPQQPAPAPVSETPSRNGAEVIVADGEAHEPASPYSDVVTEGGYLSLPPSTTNQNAVDVKEEGAFASDAAPASTETTATRAGTTWEDLDLNRYVIFGSMFVFCVDSTMYPFEVLRTRMQADSVTHQKSIVNLIRRIVRQEGVLRLYRGIFPAVGGSFPAQATYYAAYEFGHHQYDQLLRRATCHTAPGALPASSDLAAHALAGLTAELAAAMFYLPADTISQRLQTQPRFSFAHAVHQYRGAGDVARAIFATHGLRGFYQGLAPHLLAYVPSGAVYWGAYEAAKRKILTGGAVKSEWGVNACAASVAGAAAVLVSNPADVLRTRVQTYDAPKPPRLWDLARKMWADEGVAGFTKGLRPRLMVAVPGSVLALSGYEVAKKLARATGGKQVEEMAR
ncbi:hypothetical protein AMAG_16850 [Allomyces macrogynus ATCC 38327]|uniref:Mitochondrial carrier protein n=1 Tax=Allomyces macrogynus (strain ATCC 38327) TaxID=578462 RepID=A0A0L0TC97_ALLM3|nr:hypothetical protein AMAG_16850 [Allomyces macrogynus ATCC 38327]|eukprot:KNE72367.1 hypothetical protein AMAG_16850 [Allomyces macrogynus ATCC 38327]